ncbi:MAG TPA: type VI immunity family protein [Pyrinomonadaceae bacterium]|nr:type VI immunity family protein [Pyrinomonadaceae bacterium]
MNWPEIKVTDDDRVAVADSFDVTFYLWQSHVPMIRAVEMALDEYLRLVGPDALRFHVDAEGDTQPVTPDALEALRFGLFRSPGRLPNASLLLLSSETELSRFSVNYVGRELNDPRWPDLRNFIRFRLPTSFVAEAGLDALAGFARSLTEFLPLSFGYASPAIAYENDAGEAVALAPRYPGHDVADPVSVSLALDEQAAGVYWLSFLGRALTEKLGGVGGLQSELPPPVSVEPISYGGAAVRVGAEPEVGEGDARGGFTLYRLLARVLEPHLHMPRGVYFVDADHMPDRDAMIKWHRRFLD